MIAPGVAGGGGLTTTAKVCAVLVPQELLAVTVIFPLTADAPALAVIEFVVEDPVHPVGKLQL